MVIYRYKKLPPVLVVTDSAPEDADRQHPDPDPDPNSNPSAANQSNLPATHSPLPCPHTLPAARLPAAGLNAHQHMLLLSVWGDELQCVCSAAPASHPLARVYPGTPASSVFLVPLLFTVLGTSWSSWEQPPIFKTFKLVKMAMYRH